MVRFDRINTINLKVCGRKYELKVPINLARQGFIEKAMMIKVGVEDLKSEP